jgi:sec-independent protein translocase protein TatA
MPNIGPLELVIILVIALLILGPGRLPDVGAALGKGIREFRKAATDVQDATKLEPPGPSAARASEPAAAEPAPASAAPQAVEPAAVPSLQAASVAPATGEAIPADAPPPVAAAVVEAAPVAVSEASGRPADDDSTTPAADASA